MFGESLLINLLTFDDCLVTMLAPRLFHYSTRFFFLLTSRFFCDSTRWRNADRAQWRYSGRQSNHLCKPTDLPDVTSSCRVCVRVFVRASRFLLTSSPPRELQKSLIKNLFLPTYGRLMLQQPEHRLVVVHLRLQSTAKCAMETQENEVWYLANTKK